MLDSLRWIFITASESSFQTHTHTTSCCSLTADNAMEIADSYFKLLQKAPPLLLLLFLPHQSAGGEWSCVASSERVSYLVLSPRLCLGTDLCVCVVHNGCVYTGFSVHMFIHACTFILTCRLLFSL